MTQHHSIQFLLNGEQIEIHDVDPSMTLLQYLREQKGLTGTKEGCAEGDCGACTVALVDHQSEDTPIKAINACIRFLPTLDGEDIVTVEGLSDSLDALHPVQAAMVESHASQCGFCTPGFVMSLFALYKNHAAVDREAIDHALSGNLCRCTGYRPIVDAGLTMHNQPANDQWLQLRGGSGAVDEARRSAHSAIQRDSTLALSHADRQFFAPTTTDALNALLAEHPEALLLAGGTDVGLWVTKHHRKLETVIYLGRVRALHQITHTETDIEIGSAVTLQTAMPVIVDEYPSLRELFLRFASTPIRNSGTLGGNVANGSPIGDSMPALIALGAILVLRSAEGTRELPIEDYFIDYQVQDLKSGEYLAAVRLPRANAKTTVHSYKISKRFDQDISAVCLGAAVTLNQDRVEEIRLAFGGVAATPKRAKLTESVLTGRRWALADLTHALKAIEQEFEPLDDMRASAQYRRWVCSGLLRRLYEEVSDQQPTSLYRHA